MLKPNYTITPTIAVSLMRIEACKQALISLPLTPKLLASLRESSRLQTVHFSTAIEGNRLSCEVVEQIIKKGIRIENRERDRREVLGYYATLEHLENCIKTKEPISEMLIQTFHALVMGGGRHKVKPTVYRDGQNVIREGGTNAIVYLPPEAKDVPKLMADLVQWINDAFAQVLPCPLIAGIAHYQFATIHPYFDGNGRVGRILATYISHLGGYGMNGIYSLDEHYAKDLASYYKALDVGNSHNYYFGRADANVTDWIEYFCSGMAESFEYVKNKSITMQGHGDLTRSKLLQNLDPRQRSVLGLFNKKTEITSKDIQALFKFSPRMARELCLRWTRDGFLAISQESKKGRRYKPNF